MPASAKRPPLAAAAAAAATGRQEPRPAGTGRKARRKRRDLERQRGGTLLKAPMLRGHTAAGRLRLLDTALGCIHAPLFRVPDTTRPTSESHAAWSWPHALELPASARASHGYLAVDVGVGDTRKPTYATHHYVFFWSFLADYVVMIAVTTFEMATRLQPSSSGARGCRMLVGTEADESRVRAGAHSCDFSMLCSRCLLTFVIFWSSDLLPSHRVRPKTSRSPDVSPLAQPFLDQSSAGLSRMSSDRLRRD